MPVSLLFGNCVGSASMFFGYLLMKSPCSSLYHFRNHSHSFPLVVYSFLYDEATLSSIAVSSSVQVKCSFSVLPCKLTFLFLNVILHWVKKHFAHEEMIKLWKMSQNSSCYQFHLNRTKLSHGSMGTECQVEIFGRLKICSVPCEHSLSVFVSFTCSTWLNELIDQKHLHSYWL